jgi:predicted nucleic acid-binding protein
MAVTLTSLLADFSNSVGDSPSGIGLLRAVKVMPEAAPEPQQQPAVDRQAELIRSVEAKVRAEEREAARKELETAIAAERARHLDELDHQRIVWVEQQSEAMAAQVTNAIEQLEANISERVANILRPFLADAYRAQSLAEFKDHLETLLSGRDAGLLKISGPDDLLSAMQIHLRRYGSSIEFIPSEHIEISAKAQDTIVQTQLNSWSARLAQALEG